MTPEKILIVEDERIVALEIRSRVQKLGYTVTGIESSGEKALESIRTNPPDLILMDIRLQGKMDGIQTAERILDQYEIPVIYLTAHSDYDTLDRAKKTMPYGYVLKPLNEQILMSNIEMALFKHRMEKRLKTEEHNFLKLAVNAGDAIFVVDDKGAVVFANRKASELTELSPEDLLLSHISKLITPIDPVMAGNDNWYFSETPVDMEAALAVKKGDPVRIEINGTRTLWKEQPAFLILVRDVTQLKRIEEEKRKVEQHLEQARKLQAVGVLAGGIAHEFSNILSVVTGYITMAKMDLSHDKTLTGYLSKAEAASFKAALLTKRLLTFSEGGDPVKTEISLPEIVREACTFSLRDARSRCEFHLGENIRTVKADRDQIDQAVHTIVTNASQAMPGGGVIRVLIENVTIESDASFPVNPGNYVKIAFRDNGEGIPESILPDIFNPFFSTKPGASGLGLTTAYSIVKKHGGHITAGSCEGSGAEIVIYLPAVEQPGDKSERSSQRKGKILFMDDEKEIRIMMGKMLKRMGYEYKEASEGKEAVSLFKQAGDVNEPFDAVILDLMIPDGMGGKETIEILREIDPGVKAVVAGGYSNDPVMSDYEAFGFRAVIEKPVTFAEMETTLRDLLSKAG